MAPTERPHTGWAQRLAAFHRAVLKLHMRRFRRLAQFRFVHAVWFIPLAGLIGPMNIHADYWVSWIVATAAWLSLVWRVPLDDSNEKVHVLLPRNWWPHYNRAVSVGVFVCLILMVFPLFAFVSEDTPIEEFLPVIRGTLVEASVCALILSAVYHFFFGYVVGLMRLSWTWPRRVDRRRIRGGSAVRDERKSIWVTRANLYLITLLSISGFFLIVSWPPSIPELLFLLLASILPIMFFRSPWVGNRRSPVVAILPHTYCVWLLGSAVYGTLSDFFIHEFANQRSLLVTVITGLGKFEFIGDGLSGLTTLAGVTYFLTAISRMKGNLVAHPEDSAGVVALSIHGDARMYVDWGGYSANLINYVRRSNSGVIGITGLRGAGKTALLHRVTAEFSNRYAVVSMTAPISRHEGHGFLMSVCRTICRQTIEKISSLLYGWPRVWQRALSEFVQRARTFLAVVLLIVAGVWLARSTSDTSIFGVFARPALLPLPEQVRIGDAIVPARVDFVDNATEFQQVVAAERRAIAGLIGKVDSVLSETNGARATFSHGVQTMLAPHVTRSGFDLIRVNSPHDGHRQLVRRGRWLPDSVRAPERWEDLDFWKIWLVLSLHNQSFSSEFRRYWKVDNSAAQNSKVAQFVRLQESFFRYVLDREEIHAASGLRIRFSPDFAAAIFSMQLLRGHPALQGHLEAEIAALKELLGVTDPIIRDQELASVVVFSAFYRQIDSESADNANEYVLTLPRLRNLRAILVRYLGLLNGNTPTDPKFSGQATPAIDLGRVHLYWNFVAAGMSSVWPLFVMVLLLLFGGTMWRYGNFVLRALRNWRLLALVRASENFLEFLDYSEGREASRGFSLRGLSFGARRVLTSRALTLQSLTDRYLGYVRMLRGYYNGKLVVVIDELDKVTDPRHVRDILLELKGALFEEGCYYIFSISEDAARKFRGRLSEGRDIFESSFDDIITIDYMPAETAREMVRRRLATDPSLPQIDDASIDVLTMFSGGIPREIIRHLRESVMSSHGTRSFAPRNVGLQVLRSEVEEWLSRIAEAPAGGGDLVRLRENGRAILSDLRTAKEGSSWPVEIAGSLQSNLAILDPKNLRASVDLVSHREILAEVAGGRDGIVSPDELRTIRGEMRRMAEVQTCIRLLVMDTMMVRVWSGAENEWRPLVPDVISCLRLVMQQPALAERELAEIESKLRDSRPELPASTE